MLDTLAPEQPVSTAPASTPTPTATDVGASPAASPAGGLSQTSTSPAPAGQVSQPTPQDIAAAALGQAPANRAGQQPISQPSLPPEVQRQLDEARYLRQQYAQYQPYIQRGIEAARREQEEQARQQRDAASKPWFDLPKFDRSLLEMVEKDPVTGELRARPGAPVDALAQYHQFQRAFSDFQLGFAQDPAKYLAGPIQRIAEQVAQQAIESRFGGYRDEVTANQILAEHAAWMIERTPEGGQRLTQAGQLYEQYVREANDLGIRGSQRQHKYALAQVQNAYYAADYRHRQSLAGQGAAGEQQKQQFVQQAALGQQGAGPATAAQPSAGLAFGDPTPSQPGKPLDLAEMVRQRLKHAGVTDENAWRQPA